MAFFEIIFRADDFLNAGFTGRDEIEDPLDEALHAADYGEVTGGGTGLGFSNIDVEVRDNIRVDEAISFLRSTLQSLNAPKSTVIKCYKPKETEWRVY